MTNDADRPMTQGGDANIRKQAEADATLENLSQNEPALKRAMRFPGETELSPEQDAADDMLLGFGKNDGVIKPAGDAGGPERAEESFQPPSRD